MAAESTRVLKLFYCYAREDRALRDELDLHLSGLKRQSRITAWYDREISPGMEWQREIDSHLNASDIVLLLVSPHFMVSDYCYGIEMKRALERHDMGTCRVVPILLRPVDWEDAPFSKLQVLPDNVLPATSWLNRDEAYWNVARGIRQAVKDLLSQKTKEQWLDEGHTHFKDYRFNEALAAYEQAIRLDSSDASTE